MDLLEDYGSENSSSDDEERPSSFTPVITVALVGNDGKSAAAAAAAATIDIVPSRSVSPSTFVRSVPHIPGNWAGHVFCPVPSEWQPDMTESVLRFRDHLLEKQQQQQGGLAALQGKEKQRLQIISHVDDDIDKMEGSTLSMKIHLSLSRPFALQWSSVSSFVAQLQQRLEHLPATTLRVHPTAEQILVNDDRTRSFWTWPMDANPTLLAILEEINSVLQQYNQPPYYDPPLFHLSLASVVGDLEATLAATTMKKKDGDTNPKAQTGARYMKLNQVHCTFGTSKYYKIDLRER